MIDLFQNSKSVELNKDFELQYVMLKKMTNEHQGHLEMGT